MIDEAFLPMWPCSQNSFGKNSFQHPHPLTKKKGDIAANEKVNVIRHDDITPDGNSAFSSGSGELDETLVNSFVCEQFLALVRVERDKIQRGIVFLKHKL